MSSQAHWHCPKCGTFDGPISAGCCDVCADTPWNPVEWLVPRSALHEAEAEAERLRGKVLESHDKAERLRTALGPFRALAEVADEWGGFSDEEWARLKPRVTKHVDAARVALNVEMAA